MNFLFKGKKACFYIEALLFAGHSVFVSQNDGDYFQVTLKGRESKQKVSRAIHTGIVHELTGDEAYVKDPHAEAREILYGTLSPKDRESGASLTPLQFGQFSSILGQNFPARSFHKLIECLGFAQISVNGKTALDLGASPGSWSEVLYALGADVQSVWFTGDSSCYPTRFVKEHTYPHQGEGDLSTYEGISPMLAQNDSFDLIVSDASSVGDDFAIDYKILQHVRALILKKLAFGGSAVVKVRGAADHPGLVWDQVCVLSTLFEHAYVMKPCSSWPFSFELYFIGKNRLAKKRHFKKLGESVFMKSLYESSYGHLKDLTLLVAGELEPCAPVENPERHCSYVRV